MYFIHTSGPTSSLALGQEPYLDVTNHDSIIVGGDLRELISLIDVV